MNPFSQFKPFKKDPTSEWPLFSHWLDDTLDIATAPVQYSIYFGWAIGAAWFVWHRVSYNKLAKLVPDGIVSDMNKHHLMDKLKTQMYKGILMPFVLTFTCASVGAVKRNEEVDRDGSRFKEYWQRSRYAGLEEAASVALARDIVMKSDTHKEGQELLILALSNLVNMGVIQAPKYTPEGVYAIPEHLKRDKAEFVPGTPLDQLADKDIPLILPDTSATNPLPQPVMIKDQKVNQQDH